MTGGSDAFVSGVRDAANIAGDAGRGSPSLRNAEGDFGRRMANTQLFALTSPLLTTSAGAKMGKTAAGAVWLNADGLGA